MPGQASASEVHPTVRIPLDELSQNSPGTPGQAHAAATSPLPQPGATYGAPATPPAQGGPGTLARVLGILVGLLVGLVGFVMVLLGQASPNDTMRPVLFLVGLLVLAGGVALGRWTAAVPIATGLVAAIPGLFGVLAPNAWADLVRQLPTLDFQLAEVPANIAIAALGTHVPAAAGVLLVVAGVMAFLARRRAT